MYLSTHCRKGAGMCVKLWHVMYITDNDPVVMKRHGFLFSLGLHMYIQYIT